MSKSSRIEARLEPESERRIADAARLRHESVSGFVVHAALAEADRVLARGEATLMPADLFDALIDSLDVADSAPTLGAAARRPRRFTRA